MKFQLDLLHNLSIDTINYQNVDIELYKSHLLALSKRNYSSIDELPDYLRILMAMSVRDSSFIISVDNLPHNEWKRITMNSDLCYYKVNIVDLDIKPIEKLEKYIQEIKLHG